MTSAQEHPGALPDVSIWPEDRLIEEIDANGGEATREVATLLTEFGAHHATADARRNISTQLQGVGIAVEPALDEAELGSNVTLRRKNSDGDAPH